MSRRARVGHPMYNLLPTQIEGFDSLAELALDLRWSWNHATDQVWRQLDPDLWEITHNPRVVLQTVSRDRIERVLGDPASRQDVDGQVRARVCDGLGFLGIELEGKRNAANEGVISAADSRVTVRVIRTGQELTIARSVCRVLGLGARGSREPSS